MATGKSSVAVMATQGRFFEGIFVPL